MSQYFTYNNYLSDQYLGMNTFIETYENEIKLNFGNNTKIKYRLGDMVRLKNSLGENMRNKPDGYEYHSEKFPNSIATEYMSLTDKDYDLNVLNEIIRKRTNKNHTKYKDYLVIHLRTGDVIDNTSHSVDEFLKYKLKPTRISYVQTRNYYKSIIEQIKNYNYNKKMKSLYSGNTLNQNINKVLIITGFHKDGNHDKSLQYIKKIISLFKSNNFSVENRINYDSDEDFLIMCNSNYFVPSGGGFSRLIKKILVNKGKTIYE